MIFLVSQTISAYRHLPPLAGACAAFAGPACAARCRKRELPRQRLGLRSAWAPLRRWTVQATDVCVVPRASMCRSIASSQHVDGTKMPASVESAVKKHRDFGPNLRQNQVEGKLLAKVEHGLVYSTKPKPGFG